MKRRGLLQSATLCLALLASTPGLAEPRPAGLRPAPASAEAGIWDLFDKAEQHVRRSAELNTDANLNAYVRGVACKVAANYCNDIRVYVLDRPFFQATMAPNGYTEVWSGLLLRCEDEAELAFVLGHEAGHFAENHSIEQHVANKNRANLTLALTVGVAVAGTVAAAGAADPQSARSIMDSTGNLIDAIYLSSIASYFSFGRAHETEADQLGFKAATAAGYRADGGADLWGQMLAETAASDFPKVRKQEARLSVFSTHPLSTVRMQTLRDMAAAEAAPGEDGRLRFRQAIRPFLGAWLKDDLRRRDFGETLYIIDRLEKDGQDLGVLSFYRGEALRQRNKTGDLPMARDAYAVSVKQLDAPLAAWRELGEASRKLSDAASAKAALETYLSRAPEAEDAWMVRDTLKALSGAT